MIRDYDEKELKKNNPILYLQKKIDYDFGFRRYYPLPGKQKAYSISNLHTKNQYNE